MSQKINHREVTWAIRDLIDPEISNIQILILHTALACSDQNFEFHYGATNFGYKCRCGRTTIQDNIKVLKDKKYILLTQKGGKSCKDTNHYKLNVDQILANSTFKTSPANGLVGNKKYNGLARQPARTSPAAGHEASQGSLGRDGVCFAPPPVQEQKNGSSESDQQKKEETIEDFEKRFKEKWG